MEVTLKRPGIPLLFAALSLLACQPKLGAQTPAPYSSSSSLPDAPQPQLDTPAQPKQKHSPLGLTTLHDQPQDITLSGMPKRLLRDQAVIWTSPARLQPRDALWLVPFATATGLLIGSDHHSMSQSIDLNADSRDKADKVSQAALVGVGLLPASGYVWSLVNHAPQARETGLLAGEALVNSLAVNEALKVVFRRERPLENNANGRFFRSPWNDGSFPSNHATMAWSMASVFASEYPGWLTTTAAYSMASAVSVSRVLAEQHFPSDVLVGSVSGWLIGRYVYKAHHNYRIDPYDTPPLPDDYIARNATPGSAALPAPPPPPQFAMPKDPIARRLPRLYDGDPDAIGSTNVPMDSWIYPALERLGALGLIPNQNVSIRPWTRQECKRQVNEAKDQIDRIFKTNPGLVKEAQRLVADLEQELSGESTTTEELALESVYARVGTIAGPALYDGFHFGQTWWNDFGRPLGRGTSAIAGFSTRAHYGRMFFYAREEMQQDPGRPEETAEHTLLFNQLDRVSPDAPFIEPVAGHSATTRQRPLELYAGVAFAGNALSFGKQQIYWGPSTMAPLSFSSNAEPTYNLRLVSTRPHPLPLLPELGTYRFDIVLGKLSGHRYPARPWFNGQKLSFNLGDNLEIGFTRWSIFLGEGHPLTSHNFKENLFSFNSTGNFGGGGLAPYGDRDDPGDRKSNFDFRYKLPLFRRAITLYADGYSDDDPSPLAAPRRAAWNPGIYFARLPWLSNMDLRVEATSTQGLPRDFGGAFYFINNQYLDGNTNKGFLLGTPVGRDGRAIETRAGYWLSARTRIEGGYRQDKIGIRYLAGGGTITDGFLNASVALSSQWMLKVFAQYERFLIPTNKPGAQNNTSGWVQVTWTPKVRLAQ